MTQQRTKIPQKAMYLQEPLKRNIAFNDNNGNDRIEMTAYSGKVIKGHWYWGDLAIDLSGMSFPKSRYPLLEEHDKEKKIGFTERPIIENNRLTIIGTLVDTTSAEKFKRLSKQGFPYQASIYAKPSQIEKLADGETSIVNGFSVSGPASIWRKAEFREASICVFGWDQRTNASTLSRRDASVHMTLDEENEAIANELLALAYGYKPPSSLNEDVDDEVQSMVDELVSLSGFAA